MADWFYGKNGQQFGPVDEATFRARIVTGEIAALDKVWTEGMPEWLPLSQVNLTVPPALPGASAPMISGDAGGMPGQSIPSNSPYAPPASGFTLDQGVGMPPLPATNSLAIASLICGILSLITFCLCGGFFFGIPALICGHISLSQFKSPANNQDGRGMAIAGLICGYIGLAVFILMVIGSDSSYEGITY